MHHPQTAYSDSPRESLRLRNFIHVAFTVRKSLHFYALLISNASIGLQRGQGSFKENGRARFQSLRSEIH